MMAAGLMGPAAGTYKLFGETMPIFDEARLATRLRLGLVFDGGQLFNHLTVWENVALPLRYHQDLTKAEAEQAVKKLLVATELEPWADSTPGAMGRHWQKRVGLARALSLEPELLLIDTPLSGLDLRHASWWTHFLEDLSKGWVLGHGPVTLVVSAADLRPWQGQAHQYAIIRNKTFSVLGTWQQLEAASEELLKELLPARTQS
jgi:ABC-type transporter Mla maintaining outer membrane lipid asymmetry ATPase subunit MlaF